MTAVWRAASWAVPPLFCVAFYWYGLVAWFRQDDFAWLQLPGLVESWRDLPRVMFTPLAQGTIRPWSERLYFIGLYSLFGLDPLPFRIVAFATQIANLTLLRAVAARLTGSQAAGFWAALLWMSNTALMVVMTWSAPYNQALCAFFLLLAFYLLLRYTETGDRRYGVAQWIVYLLGFGALELNVVYPAIACGYTFLCARPYFRRTLWLFVPALIFTAIHRAAAVSLEAPAYAMQFDLTILDTLATYIGWARGTDYDPQGHVPRWLWDAGTTAILLALAGFTARCIARGAKVAAFCWIWFFALLAPVLPLRLHLTDYYLMLPVIGLAILGAWGLVTAWRSGTLYRAAAVALVAIYVSALPALWAATRARYQLTRRIEGVVLGSVRARELHPDQIILLTGVDDDLFWNGILDQPFRLVGVSNVFISPLDGKLITPHPELGALSEFVLPEAAMIDGLKKGSIVVYSAAGERMRNITGEFTWRAETSVSSPSRVDVANDLMAPLLGSGWYELEENHRWMGAHASLRIGGPKNASQRLHVSGYCPPQQLEKGPLPLTLRVDGKALPAATIQAAGPIAFDFELPPAALGKPSIDLEIEIPRTFLEEGAEGRRLGLVFGVFEVK